MKSLSIKQPWAQLIAEGIKDIENRTWPTKFRGRIYIHASAKRSFYPSEYEIFLTDAQLECISHFDENSVRHIQYKEGITRAIIGEVDIIDCVINHPSIWAEKTTVSGIVIDGKLIGKDETIYNWVLANPVLYETPIINVKGKLSFWEPDIIIQECIGCSHKFNYEEMEEDDAGERYCQPCWDELSPIFQEEYRKMNEENEQ